jgi:hypothetical protein
LAEKARGSITKAFQDALCCRVELKITLAPAASLPGMDLQQNLLLCTAAGDYPIRDGGCGGGDEEQDVGKPSSQSADHNIYCVMAQAESRARIESNAEQSTNCDKEIPILETHDKPYDESCNDRTVSVLFGEANKKKAGIVDVGQTKQVLVDAADYAPSPMRESSHGIGEETL